MLSFDFGPTNVFLVVFLNLQKVESSFILMIRYDIGPEFKSREQPSPRHTPNYISESEDLCRDNNMRRVFFVLLFIECLHLSPIVHFNIVTANKVCLKLDVM